MDRMKPRNIMVVVITLLLVSAVAPAMAAGPSDTVDNCQNAEKCPSGDAGPPGFVSGLVSGVTGFLGDLFAALPVPNFVKGLFGAPTCQ